MGLIHLQATLPGWLEPVRRAPDYSLVKTVDQGQVFREVKGINSKIYTCLRHWYDGHQVFGGTFEENKERARTFFESFIETYSGGTFIEEIAEHCDYVEEWNEYIASSDTPEETAERVLWAQAAAEVWRDEYRTIPELSHIRLVICNAAIGNWIHRDFAAVASAYDCAIGYHPYTAWGWDNKPKVRWGEDEPLDMGVLDTLDWVYLSGLWDSMELDWEIPVDWVFTEAGPFEGATDGWKSPTCLGGDLDLYVASVRDWIRDVQTTPAYAEGRIKGFGLFTMDTPNDGRFASYQTNVYELNHMVDMLAVEWKPGTPVVEPDPEPDVNYVVVANLLPQDATKAEKHYVVDEEKVHEDKETVLQSADDAARLVAPALPRSKVVVWEPDRWNGNIDLWLRNHGVTNIEYQYFPEEGYTITDIVNDLPKHETDTYRTRVLTDITTLTIHHTVTPSSTPIEVIAAYHVNSRDWPGIGYHFVIKDTGEIFKTNYLETKSYHAGSYGAPGDENLWSVGIALQGNFTDDPPPQAQLDAAQWLVAELKEQLDISQVLKHKEMPGAQTQCPGNTSGDWIDYVAG